MKEAPTRERLLEAARYLFWERGYAATGMSDILERAGARSGSFYHFFRSKEELLNEVLQSYVEGLHPMLIAPSTQGVRDPVAKVFAVLAGYRERLVETGFTYGCPIGRLALELDTGGKVSRRLIARNFEGWAKAIEGFLRDAADRFPSRTDFAGLSQFVLTVMEGGVMQSRAHGSIEPFDASVAQLRRYISLLIAQRKNPSRAR